MECGILVPRQGVIPIPPALEVQSLNHWITRKVPKYKLFRGSVQDDLDIEKNQTFRIQLLRKFTQPLCAQLHHL